MIRNILCTHEKFGLRMNIFESLEGSFVDSISECNIWTKVRWRKKTNMPDLKRNFCHIFNYSPPQIVPSSLVLFHVAFTEHPSLHELHHTMKCQHIYLQKNFHLHATFLCFYETANIVNCKIVAYECRTSEEKMEKPWSTVWEGNGCEMKQFSCTRFTLSPVLNVSLCLPT